MKMNWKFAIMAFAALALVGCEKDPVINGDDEEEEKVFASLVSTADNSVAEWDNLPTEYVAVSVGSPDAVEAALTSLKVYNDQMYLNILVEFDEAQITDREWTPFHVYLDADNSDETGGFGDQWLDADAEVMLETAIFSAGVGNNYDPAVFKWWGEVGGTGWNWTDPDVTHDGTDFWGAVIGEGQGGIGTSQVVGNKIEIQLLRELIPFPFAETFGIGVDIQQAWSSVGILPNAAADATTGAKVLAEKLKVTTDPTFYEAE